MKATPRLTPGLSCSLVTVIGAALAAGPAQAQDQEFAFGLRAGANYSDNVNRVPVDETSASSAIVGVDFSGAREAGRLQYETFGNVEYQHFFEDGVDDETYGSALLRSTYGIVPDRFTWNLSGSYGQTRTNLLRPIAPGNVEDVIALSTGPQLTLRFGDSLESTIEGHYVIADYEEQPFDSETVGGSLLFGHHFSTRGYLGVGGSLDQVSYDEVDPRLQDFDRREFFLRFNAEGARTTLELDAGYSQVDGDTIDEGGPLVRLDVTRELTPSVSAFANFVQEFPTSASATLSPGSPPQLDTDSSVLTGGPRKTRDLTVGLQRQGARFDLRLAYVNRDEEELETAATRDYDVFTLSGTYAMAPRASLTLFGRYVEETLGTVEAEQKIYGARVSLQLGRRTSLNFRVEQRDRDSDAPAGSYEELLAGVFLRYGGNTNAQGWR